MNLAELLKERNAKRVARKPIDFQQPKRSWSVRLNDHKNPLVGRKRKEAK